MSVSASILNEKAYYGEKLGAHSGHSLNLLTRDYYDSSTVTFVHEHGIDCDDCGAMILDALSSRQMALEIMDIISPVVECDCGKGDYCPQFGSKFGKVVD